MARRQSCRRFRSSHNHSPPTTSNVVSRQQSQLIVPLFLKQFRDQKKKKITTFLNSNYKSNKKKKKCTFGKKQCCLETKTSHRHLLSATGSPVFLHHWHTEEEKEKKSVQGQTAFPFFFWQEIVKRRDSEHVSTEEGGTEERVMYVCARVKE